MNQTTTRKIRLQDRIYYYLDLIIKVVSEGLLDAYYFSQRAVSVVVGKIFVSISFFFINPFDEARPLIVKLVLGIPRIVAGLVILSLLCLMALVGILLAGTLASLLGFRNIADYTFKEQIAAWISFMILLAFLPFHLSDYYSYKVSLIFCHILILIGFNFLYGQCGIISLGHAGFVFWGSYMTTFLYQGTFGFKLPHFLSTVVAAFTSFLLGVVIGLPSLRVKDYYLVIITLAFTISLPQILRSKHFAEYSGLASGGLSIDQIVPPSFVSSWMTQSIFNYFYVVGIGIFLIIFAYNIIHHSQVGRALKTIKCDIEISTNMGIPAVRYKLLAFAMSAFYASVAGSLISYLNKFISPDSYTVNDSIDYIVASVIGGPTSILGSSFGGLFLTFEKDLSGAMAKATLGGSHLTRMFYGVFMILVVFLAPRGIVGELTAKFKSVISKKPQRGLYYLSPPADYDFLEMKSPTIKED